MHRNNIGFRAFLGAATVFVLGASCADLPHEEPLGTKRSSLTEPIIIDDLTTGAITYGTLTIDTVDDDTQVQTGAGIAGDERTTILIVTENLLGRPTSVEIRTGGSDGYLALDSGAGVSQALLLEYGLDEYGAPDGLDLDLTEHDAFQIDFAELSSLPPIGALDLDTAGGIEVYSDYGFSAAPFGCVAGNLSCKLEFSEFVGDADWEHIQQIVIEIQTGGLVPAHDYVLQKISVVQLEE